MSSGHRTLVFAFATFHSSAFVVIAVLIAYRGGGLGNTLQALNTAVGLGLFMALWLTTFIATRNALKGILLASALPIDDRALVGGALKWGGANGFMFLVALLSVFAAGNAASQPENIVQGTLFLVAALFPVGGIALVIGGLIGVVFAGIDLILLGIAARLLPAYDARG